MKRSLIINAVSLLAALCTIGCVESSEPRCTVPAGETADWIRVIGCERDHALLVAERVDSVFARTATMNWLIDREDGNRLYFINSETWRLHYEFASAYLQHADKTPVGTHGEFNLLNYRRPERRFVLGKLVHYRDQDLYTVEFSAGDTAGTDMIVEAFDLISEQFYRGDDLRYRPVSNDHERLLSEIAELIPVISTEDVFQGQAYQPLNLVEGFGTLRFLRAAELAASPPSPSDIVVLDRVPNDISLVSGIVTQEFQTPLSHVNLLSKNRGTPNMALRDAFENPDLRALEGELVQLVVGPQGYEVSPASRADAEAYWDSLRPKEVFLPRSDLTVDSIQNLSDLRIGATIFIGAKAANLAELIHMDAGGVPTPDQPFAIPFSFYRRHLQANGIDADIEQFVAEVAAGTMNETERRARLFALRWKIYRAPMNEADLQEIVASISARWQPDIDLRFRSSTNVEDLANFSGAGLYTSAGAASFEGPLAIADAVRVVWASAWNDQAFVERDFYRVDHLGVQMGVLVHPAFGDERANGVAVTINEFADNRPAFYINSQLGEVSVTNPTGQAVPEQILYYTWYEEPEYEVITRSSLLPEGGPRAVLSDAQLSQLGDVLEQIHNHFRPLYPTRERFAMDVEFKIDRDGRLVIKQARPLATAP